MNKSWRIIKKILFLALLLVFIKVFWIFIIYLSSLYFPNSNYKMYLPWNKKQAIETAQDYYYQRYKKKIKYDRMKIYALTEQGNPEYYYNVYFKLEDEPECGFKIKVDYDLREEKYWIEGDHYIIQAMDKRMENETKHILKSIYGRKYRIIFLYDSELISDESMTLEELKSTMAYCYYNLSLDKYSLSEKDPSREAEKLYNCYVKMKEKGYVMSDVIYNKDWYDGYIISIEYLESISQAEQLIREALEEE